MKGILKPISRIYLLGMSVRNKYYASNLISQITPPVFTICVGNISWGGTGKTPICEYLLNFFHKKNISPVLISRGYKGKPPRYPFFVKESDPVYFTGDEPLMLKRLCPFADVVVDPKRERGLFFAWKKFKPHVAILDDGFQYVKLKRHLDIVLFTKDDLTKNWNRVIPYGSWREGENSITRANVLMVNTTGQKKQEIECLANKKLMGYNKPIFLFNTKIRSISDVKNPNCIPDKIPKRYILVVGIGNPEKVYKSAKDYFGTLPIKFIKYPDHHRYTKKDISFLHNLAQKYRAAIITTQKDAVKLSGHTDFKIFALNLDVEIHPELHTKKSFEKIIEESFLKYKSSH